MKKTIAAVAFLMALLAPTVAEARDFTPGGFPPVASQCPTIRPVAGMPNCYTITVCRSPRIYVVRWHGHRIYVTVFDGKAWGSRKAAVRHLRAHRNH